MIRIRCLSKEVSVIILLIIMWINIISLGIVETFSLKTEIAILIKF